MITLHNKQDCCGCSACYSACPNGCITMSEDGEGFFYPHIVADQCTDCGLCVNVCPFVNPRLGIHPRGVYAAKNKNEATRVASSSGGVFSLFADSVLESDGVVFGAAFDANFEIVHIGVSSKVDLHLLRGSKYVQSRIGNSYREAKQHLQNGRIVLFTGTPCQVAGLKGFLKTDYDNLICIDIVCHGVPSLRVFKKYLFDLQQSHGGKVSQISFRNKSLGWKLYSVAVCFDNNTEYRCSWRSDNFMTAFLSNLSIRPSCTACKTKGLSSGSDITMADYWGVGSRFPHFDDDMGASLVLINSSKGQALFNRLSDHMDSMVSDLEHATEYNPYLMISVKAHYHRDKFFSKLECTDFARLVAKISRMPIHIRGKLLVVRILRKLGLINFCIRLKETIVHS
jgi:coenzyme F420-reducing hydrogenase beta subunit